MNAAGIVRSLQRHVFHDKALIMMPNSKWTGHEADLLVVDKASLRLIDIEIKISRSDFKRDADKKKWWQPSPDRWVPCGPERPAQQRQWPPKVWKHYFAMPSDVWRSDMVEQLPSPKCGVLIFDADWPNWDGPYWRIARRAHPDRHAAPISHVDAIDIARIASMRMWDALNHHEPAN